mmetsp:Transcript_323/g.541  ORF Transcript_323/g.541 Transcript_323/m.541 type:complete len:444 (+) Transcript_323:42-1373(+)
MKSYSPSHSFSYPRLKQLTNDLLQKTNDIVASNIYISSCGAAISNTTSNATTVAASTSSTNGTSSDVPRPIGEKSVSSSVEMFPLLQVLHSSQELCRNLRSKDQDARIAIVHAYSDKAYNRSSFHLAGRANEVAQVSSFMATTAIDLLQALSWQQKYTSNTSTDTSQHPLVGLIDHVSVMPMVPSTRIVKEDATNCIKNQNYYIDTSNDKHIIMPLEASALAALHIAHALEQKGVQCLPYGTAHPKGIPLATVRKEWTNFFTSGSLGQYDSTYNTNANDKDVKDKNTLGTCTIGSPCHFVENFNIRLTSNTTKKQAMALTKRVRQRDGGVLGVEALTLPYSNGRWEVACNLLKPHEKEGTVDCILEKVREWAAVMHATDNTSSLVSSASNEYYYSRYVEDSYRVGTTVEQCFTVLNFKDEEAFRDHDDVVRHGFQANIMGCGE